MSLIAERPITVDSRREGRALGWLTFGLLLGPIGLAVGWYHVLTAARWSWRDKIIAALVPAPIVVIVLLMGGGVGSYSCVQGGDGLEVCDPHAPVALALLGLLVPAGLLALMLRHLRRSARGEERFSVLRPAAAAVVVVGALIALWEVPRQVESWTADDQVGDVIDAAARADDAGETYAVIGEDASDRWMESGTLRKAEAAHLAGPGNRRFAAVLDRMESDMPPSTAADRPCYVFPVVESGTNDISTVSGLAQFCYGPSERASFISLRR
ncbi:MAG: hypothetical protein JWP31_1550 [Aeromicrobium sp.]|nr:hypothetical protein [Aeromicrobium sp.]